MLLNLHDPESIVAWWKVLPDQHDVFLSHKLKVSPQFAPGITEAQRRIDSDPNLSCLRVAAIARRRQGDPRNAQREADVPSHELRWRELAAA
ncbi:MAG: hypothetical protein HY020_07095 [Burkholderiales bacterium]|nr:hypothetical protein [Burkholderiales bacterium]